MRPDDEVVRVGEAAARVHPGQRLDGLAGGRGEAGDVDECLDVGITGGGVGHDEAAVGVPDEDDRPVDRVEDALEVRGVGVDRAQRVGGREDGVVVSLQAAGDVVPAGGVGEGAVDEHDRGARFARVAAAEASGPGGR